MNQEPSQSTDAKAVDCIHFSELPPVGAELCDGIFAGVITGQDGLHVAVILLPERAEKVNWTAAMDWAQSVGGQLPTRPIAALIFANVKNRPDSGWHWTCEEVKDYASYAWGCVFSYGGQDNGHKSYEGSAVAVRTIPLAA